MKAIRRTTAICTFNVFCLLGPCAGWAAEPSDNVRNGNASRHWVRRDAQVAKIRPGKLATFRIQASRSATALHSVLARHRVKNQNLFTIQLEPNQHYALRYREYTGINFADETQRLEQDEQYKKWAHELDACLADGWSDVQCVFFTAGQVRSRVAEERVQRLGRVIGLRPEMSEPYVLLHAHTWPGVLSAIRAGNIRNYSIFLAPIGSKLYLFAYLEYVGDDFESDMAQIGSDPDTKAWIKFTDEGCQLPLSTRQPGEWWASMERLSGGE
jgi:L-rhamnose mutarotase